MEPIPETRRVLDQLAEYGELDVAEQFTVLADQVSAIAPACVGVSLSLVDRGLAFTWTATNQEAAALDAVQYLDGGPCIEAVETGAVGDLTAPEILDEGRWRLFARAEGVAGVESSLSIPLLRQDRVYGGVNLYGATPTAFEGHHEVLANLYGAWAEGSVTNADLSFSSRRRAEQAPQDLEDRAHTDQAVGMIVAAQRVDAPTAQQRLTAAAQRAGMPVVEVARFLIKTRLL